MILWLLVRTDRPARLERESLIIDAPSEAVARERAVRHLEPHCAAWLDPALTTCRPVYLSTTVPTHSLDSEPPVTPLYARVTPPYTTGRLPRYAS